MRGSPNCQTVNRTLTHFCLSCLAHPVANDTAVIATDDSLGITELAAIDVNSLPQQNALFYVGGYIFARNILRNTVAKSVLRH